MPVFGAVNYFYINLFSYNLMFINLLSYFNKTTKTAELNNNKTIIFNQHNILIIINQSEMKVTYKGNITMTNLLVPKTKISHVLTKQFNSIRVVSPTWLTSNLFYSAYLKHSLLVHNIILIYFQCNIFLVLLPPVTSSPPTKSIHLPCLGNMSLSNLEWLSVCK